MAVPLELLYEISYVVIDWVMKSPINQSIANIIETTAQGEPAMDN